MSLIRDVLYGKAGSVRALVDAYRAMCALG